MPLYYLDFIFSINWSNKYIESCGPGLASGWYWTEKQCASFEVTMWGYNMLQENVTIYTGVAGWWNTFKAHSSNSLFCQFYVFFSPKSCYETTWIADIFWGITSLTVV